MPTGQKVGDAYIEVTPELDTSKINAQMTKLADKLERKLGQAGNRAGQKFASNWNRQVGSAIRQTGRDFDDMFDRVQRAQARHHQTALRQQQAMLRAQNQQLAAQYQRQLRMRQNHINQQNRQGRPLPPNNAGSGGPTPAGAAGPGLSGRVRNQQEAIDRAHREALIEEEKRNGRKSGRSYLQAYHDIISVLPGQLEGLFKDPKIALASAAGATIAGAAIAPALVGAAGAAVGLAGVALAAKFLASADPAFQKATETLGANIKSALLTKLQTIAPVLMGVMQQGASVVQDIIASLDLGPFRSIAEQVGVAFQRWGPIISDIINSLMRIGDNVMPTILSGIESLLVSFDKVLFTAEKNKDTINRIMEAVIQLANGTLMAVDGFIQLAGYIDQAYQAAKKFNPLLNFISPTGLLGTISKFGETGDAADGAATAVGGLANKMIGFGSTSKSAFAAQGAAAIDAARGLLQNAGSAEEAAKAQKDLNSAIDAYNDKVLGMNISAAEISNSLKDLSEQMKKNHGIVKLGTRAGNDNIISLGRQLDSYYQIAKGVREAGGTAQEADAKFNQLTAQLKKNKGMTDAARKAVENMAAKYRSFAGTPNITKTVKVVASGLETVRDALNALKGDIHVRVTASGEHINTSKIRAGISKQDQTATRANGGIVRGAGSTTSDSIPAMLSDKEYVIKASSVMKYGTSFLDKVNAGTLEKRASGGSIRRKKKGPRRSTPGSTVTPLPQMLVRKPAPKKAAPKAPAKKKAPAAQTVVIKNQVKRLINLNKQMAVLTKTLEKQNVIDEKYQQKIDAMRDMFNEFVNLSQIDLEGKKTGNVISELVQRSKDAKGFAGNVMALKKRGLGAEGIDQVLQAGPSSPLAKMLMSASAADIQAINKALSDQKLADDLTKNLNPAMAANRELIKSNEALRKAIERQIFILEDKGIDKKLPNQKHAGGATIFTAAQLKQIADSLKGAGAKLPAGGGIRVEVGGKEVDTHIRRVNAKDSRPQKRRPKSGGRRR